MNADAPGLILAAHVLVAFVFLGFAVAGLAAGSPGAFVVRAVLAALFLGLGVALHRTLERS
jgi:hypothetical protein